MSDAYGTKDQTITLKVESQNLADAIDRAQDFLGTEQEKDRSRIAALEGLTQIQSNSIITLDARIGDLSGHLSRIVDVIVDAIDEGLADPKTEPLPPDAERLVASIRDLKACIDTIVSERSWLV